MESPTPTVLLKYLDFLRRVRYSSNAAGIVHREGTESNTMSMEPRVRDFTAQDSSEPVVELALHSATDLLVVLWLLEGCNEAMQNYDEYGLGPDWFDDITSGGRIRPVAKERQGLRGSLSLSL